MSNNKYLQRLKHYPLLCAAFAALFAGHAPIPAVAAQLEEVIVTAQKREENLQDVPVAVTALTAELLADIGFNDITDLRSQVPSLIVLTTVHPMATTFFIRNIGNSGNIPNFEPAVGLFIDGAYRSRSGMGIGDLVDVQSIEVLKGPQSTLHGKNVTAGLISVRTQPATDHLEAMAEVSAGSDDLRQFKGYVSGPLFGDLRGRLSFADSRRDELIDNVAGPDLDNQNSYALRGQLQYDLSDRLAARLHLGYSEKNMAPPSGDVFLSDASRDVIVDAGGSVSIPNDATDRLVEYGDPNSFRSKARDLVLNLEYATGRYTLTSVTSFDDYESLSKIYNLEQMNLQIADFNDTQRGRSISQELRIASEGGEVFDWLAGAYYNSNRFERGDRDLPEFILQKDIEAYGNAVANALITRGLLPPLLPGAVPLLGVAGDRGDTDVLQDTLHLGVFSKLDWHLTERWLTSLGLRYSYEQKEGNITQSNELSPQGCVPPFNANLVCGVAPDGNDFHQIDNYDAVTGALTSTYFVSDDSMVYASLSTGFKSGGFSLQGGDSPPESRPFGEEKVTNVEMGAKTEFWNRRARINAAAFYTEYEDFQQASFEGLFFVINNAELVTVEGVEVDSTFIITRQLSATLNFAYIDTVFDKYTGGRCYYGREPDNELGQCDLSGESIAAKWKGNMALNWTHPLGSGDLYARVDYRYTGETNASAEKDPRFDRPALKLSDMRIGWRSATLDIALWGKNITDQVLVTGAAPATIHGPIDNALGSPVGSYQMFTGEPRSWGITTRLYF